MRSMITPLVPEWVRGRNRREDIWYGLIGTFLNQRAAGQKGANLKAFLLNVLFPMFRNLALLSGSSDRHGRAVVMKTKERA